MGANRDPRWRAVLGSSTLAFDDKSMRKISIWPILAIPILGCVIILADGISWLASGGPRAVWGQVIGSALLVVSMIAGGRAYSRRKAAGASRCWTKN